jgi:hypothetical protein
MTFASLIINHKLRPKYREIGTNVGKFIADAVGADDERRQKIIKVSAKAAAVGLSVGCAVLTADAVGLVHAAATSAADTADAVHSVVPVHAAPMVPAGHAMTAANAGPPAPYNWARANSTLGALRGYNQQSAIMASVGQDQATNIALSSTDGALDQAADIST